MSAWMFRHDGMDRVMAAIKYGAENGAPTPLHFLIDPTDVGKKLLQMNADAIMARYRDDQSKVVKGYKHTPVEISPMQMCKTLHCFTYQCSEGDVPEKQTFKDVVAIEEWFDEHTGCHNKQDKAKQAEYDACKWG